MFLKNRSLHCIFLNLNITCRSSQRYHTYSEKEHPEITENISYIALAHVESKVIYYNEYPLRPSSLSAFFLTQQKTHIVIGRSLSRRKEIHTGMYF